MKVPCRECQDRQVGCHGKCERYQHYKKNLEAAKVALDGEPLQKMIMTEVELQRVKRIRRRQKKGVKEP